MAAIPRSAAVGQTIQENKENTKKRYTSAEPNLIGVYNCPVIRAIKHTVG